MREKATAWLTSAAMVLSLFAVLPVTASADSPAPSLEVGHIYANGSALILAAGTVEGNTVIYIDTDRDGELDAGTDPIWTPGGSNYPDGTAQGNDLSLVNIHGGSYEAGIIGDAKITMLGGRVKLIRGGSLSGGVTGSTSVTVSGGEVIQDVVGGGHRASVTGGTSVTISGTAVIDEDVIGGNTGSVSTSLTGVSVAITGGAVAGNVNGGNDLVGTVASTSMTITGGTVSGSIITGGGTAVATSASLAVGGAAAIGAAGAGGIYLNGGAFTQGVDSFSITDDLTGADGSVRVVLCSGFDASANPVIATGAAAGDLAKIRLAGATGYIAYFDAGSIKVKPLPIPTVDTYFSRLYANGAPLLIAAGSSDGTTTIYVDANGNGQKDAEETSLAGGDVPNAPADSSILHAWSIYGATYDTAYTGNTQITMTGGAVGAIFGGCGSDGSMIGDASVTVTGGEVFGAAYGGGMGSLTGDTSVVVTGGTVYNIYAGGGGGTGGTVSGTASAAVTGGRVAYDIFSSGNAAVGAVSLTVGGSAQIGYAETDSGIVIGSQSGKLGFAGFDIAPDLAGADGSVCVWLPADFVNHSAIATGAVSGDLAGIQLVGPSASGKGIYLDGTDIEVADAYAVTLADGGTGASGGGNYVVGTAVAINAGVRSGFAFNGWSSADSITFENAGSAETAFTMPDKNVTVTASWLESVPPEHGTLQFESSGHGTYEGYYGWMIGVERIGGSDGEVSVSYSMTDGTALAGTHYVAGSGTLTWEDGNADRKVIWFTSNDDSDYLGYLTLTCILSNPTGGAALGVQNLLNIQISDNDPPPEPTGLTAAAGREQVTLSWGSVKDAYYKVYCSQASGGFTEEDFVGSVYDGTSYTVTGLTSGRTYYFAVKAGHNIYYSDFSQTASAVTTGGSSSRPSTPTYRADVKAGGGAAMTLLVTVDAGAGTAAVDVGSGTLTSGGAVVTMPGVPNVDTYTVGIPVPDLSTAGARGTLTLRTDTGNVTVPSNMLTDVEGMDGDRAQITIGAGDRSALPDDVKAALGGRPLIRLTLSIDGKQTDWSNPNAPVAVSIPYVPTAEELKNSEGIVVWYIDGSGDVVTIPNGRYDAATGTVTFCTTHFSDYAVAYQKVGFNDVADAAWYSGAVRFIAARKITSGTGNGNYSPAAKLTRGEFIVLVMSAYGITPGENPADNFADAGSTYYTNYLAEAKRRGISNGIGENRFAPERAVTRQEMFALLYNALKAIGRLPEGGSGRALADFDDAADVASWAREAMTSLAESGTISGSGGRLNPRGTTTRAEMAQVLHNLLGR